MNAQIHIIRSILTQHPLFRYLNYFYKLLLAGSSLHKTLKKEQQEWNLSLKKTKYKQILLATSIGGNSHATFLESALAVALTLRGAEVHFLLCDEVLPACQHCVWKMTISDKQLAFNGPQKKLCGLCYNVANKIFAPLGLPIHRYSKYLTAKDYDIAESLVSAISTKELNFFKYEGLSIGEHAMAGILRFYAKGFIDNEQFYEQVSKRYLKSALLTAFMMSNLLCQQEFDCVTFHHGIYVPQGIIGEVCRKMGIRVVNWVPSYKKKTFIFSHNDTYHHTLMQEPTPLWENIDLTPKIEDTIMRYLKSRWFGTEDWISFTNKTQNDLQKLTIDFSKPCIGLLTNVMWDAQLHYPANVYSNMTEWIYDTIEYFIKRQDLQLIIRIHPAEVNSPIVSRQPIAKLIYDKYPFLPANIFIIPPTTSMNTYEISSKCNAVIIYGTKTGVELTSIGIPVIVAGEAWIRNKGITFDILSKKEYRNILDKLPFNKPLDEATIKRAKKYAFHFFFRRMIPLEFTKPVLGDITFTLELDTLKVLRAGESKGLDVICEGIMNGKEFIYPAEKFM